MGLSMKLVFTLIIQLCPCFAVRESKACYGIPGLHCTKHSLQCSSGRIAIQEAFFMAKTPCPLAGIQVCSDVIFSSISLTEARYNFSDAELDSLYGNCSTKSSCTLQAWRTVVGQSINFSVIRYRCINETIDMCNITDIRRTTSSLIWRGPSQNTCVCSVSQSTKSGPSSISVTALAMHHPCPTLTISIDGEIFQFQCSEFKPHRYWFNFTDSIDIAMTEHTTSNNTVIWIGIHGTENLDIVCNEISTTTKAVTNSKSTNSQTTPTTATQATSVKSKSTTMTATQGITRSSTSLTSLRSSLVVPPDQTTTRDIGSDISRTTTSVLNHSTDSKEQKEAESKTGTVVGIIISLCIIIAAVSTAVIMFRRRTLGLEGKNEKVVKFDSKQQEAFSLKKVSSPDYDYATTNEYLDLVPETHKMRFPHDNTDNDNYDQVAPLETKTLQNTSGCKNDKSIFQPTENGSSLRDYRDANYHELEPQTDLGSSEYNLASKMESHNVKTQPGKKVSSEYVLAGNISKGGKESQQAQKGSPDYDYTGGNTYHVLEGQSALRDSSDYDYAGGNDYHEVEPQESNTSDYDYATCANQQASHSSSRNTQTRDSDYDHFGRQPAVANGHHDTTLSVAGALEGRSANEEVCTFNHLNEKAVSNINDDSTYNTTSSTRHKMDSSTNDMDDDYGYNHLGAETKKNIPQNEYDTTASAIRDLARMNGDMEDSTYDHAYLSTSDSSPSGMINAGFQESDYDHASTTTAHNECESNASPIRTYQEEGVADVYTLAGEADTNPYQLAK